MLTFFNKKITTHRKAKLHNKGILNLKAAAKLSIGRRRNKPHPHSATSLIIRKKAQLSIESNLSLFNGGVMLLGPNAIVNINSAHINEGFNISITTGMDIGSGVLIGNNVFITDSNYHELNGKRKTSSIIIEDNVWIGANCTILPGAVLRKGCVLAAGTVISSEVKAECLYGGVPAKLIKENITWSR